MVQENRLLQTPWLFGRHCISSDEWIPLRNQLLDLGLLRASGNGRYIPGRDFHHYTLWQLAQALHLFPQLADRQPTETPWYQRYHHIVEQRLQDDSHALQTTLAELFETDTPE